jgi:hypothetical protein
MSRRKLLLVALALAAVVMTIVPLSASGDNEQRVVIGVRYNLNPGPPLTGAGTWSACCGINDSGSTHAVVNITSVKNDFATIEGTHTFESSLGTFSDRFKGTLGPLSSPREVAEGRWKIVSGSGAYADLRGSGRFTVEVDGLTGTATGVHDGRVGSQDD